METLLAAGQADQVLTLGKALMKAGTQQVGMSHDDGETAMEIGSCLPVIVKALDQSSLQPVDKLSWSPSPFMKKPLTRSSVGTINWLSRIVEVSGGR